MRVLLVSTYELGHQPLHLASPAARLLAAGHEVRCLDLAVEPWDEKAFAWADRVAFSVPMHTAMRLSVEAAFGVRASHPGLPLAFYGLYGAIGADRTVQHLGEQRIVGEYEDELVAWVEGSERPPVVVDRSRQRFSLPARHLLPPLERYARLEVEGDMRLAGYVEASHGCRHRCRHCPIPAVYDGRYRTTGLETVLADVDQLVELGAQHITFGDPDFLNAPRYARDVLEAVSASFPNLTFDLTVKVEHILGHREIWEDLSRRGVLFVVSAFETTNNRILGLLDKGHTAADMAEAVSVLRSAGIHLRPSWMPFTPWTELGDMGDIMRFLAEHHLLASTDPVQLAIRLLLPEGSLLLDLPETASVIDRYDPELLGWTWKAVDPAVDELQQALARLAEDGAGEAWNTITAMWKEIMGGTEPPTPSIREVPRLTESWFCCAEPTSRQLAAVGRLLGDPHERP